MGRASSIGGWIAAKSGWLVSAIAVVAATALLAMGRAPICRCGRVRLWWGEVASAENSQQLTDWYSLSHVVHGLLFYLAGALLLPRWPWRARLVLAVAVEAAWEIAENSPAVIDRYRSVTMALGYTGDSVLNSLADIGCMALGFWAARRLPVWAAVGLGLALETIALVAIRDNLTLNVLMLVHPVEAIRVWQAG